MNNDTTVEVIDGEEYERTTLSSLTKGYTERGFGLYRFEDKYAQRCSLQESSLATEGAIWFGVDDTGPYLNGPMGERNEHINARMHLTQHQVQALLPLLAHFAETGELPREPQGDGDGTED